ncbi:MAG: hypothetical protein KGO05_07300, partial [Chloroflexota bacterium]|nr:hypothetical protein [Chloroflexota bacterium]
ARAVRDGARSSLGSLLKRAAGAGGALMSLRDSADPAEAAPPQALYGAANSADATLWDPSYHAPTGRQPRFPEGGGAGSAWPRPRASGGISPGLLAAVAAALVILIAMGVMVGSVLGNTLGSNFNSLVPGAGAATTRATPTPTVTPTPTPSPTPAPPANWLSVQPDSIKLGCKNNQKSAVVQLTNQGNDKVDWQAQVPDYFAGISVSPNNGTLDAGQSVNIKVTNTTLIGSNQGQISFVPGNDNAGDPAPLNYTTNSCFGGG